MAAKSYGEEDDMSIVRVTPLTISRTLEISILAVLLVVAILLRFYSLAALPLWLDEAFTYQISRLPLAKLFSADIDVNPPLFYLIENFALRFGHSELILRFAPAVFGVSAVCMLHLIGRRFVSPVCGLSAAAVLATSTVHIQYSQEARSYTLLFLEICIAVYGALRFIEARENTGPSDRADTGLNLNAIVIYLIGAITALYTHNISAFYIFAVNLTVLLAWRPLRCVNDTMLIHWLVAQAVLLLLWLPWWTVLLDQAQSSAFAWLEHYSFRDALRTLMNAYGFIRLSRFQPAPDVLVICLILAGMAAAFCRRRKPLAVLVGLILVVVPSVIWAVGFVKPIFMLRTIFGSLLGSALGLGLAVAYAPVRVVAIFIMAFALAGNATSTINYYRFNAKEEWSAVARMVSSGTKERELIILCEFYTYLPYRYYQKKFESDASIAGWLSKENLLFEMNDGFMEKYLGDSIRYRTALAKEDFARHYNVNVITDLAGIYQRIWLLESHCKDASKELTARIRDAGLVIHSEEQFKGIDVTVFGQP